jgi:hypothetical protein
VAFETRPGVIERIGPALRRWQTWSWAAVAAGALYLAYLLVSGLLTPATPSTSTDNEMMMHGIVSRGQHGHSGWKFIADASEISPDGFSTTYHGVRDATFYRDGVPTYHLTAKVVTADSRNQNYSATGGVHVWSTAKTLPDDLRTDNAYWDQAAQSLTCPTSTQFVYHGTTMRTTHMTVNMQTGASQLGDTSVDYRKPPGSPTPPVPPTPSVSVAPIPAPTPSP